MCNEKNTIYEIAKSLRQLPNYYVPPTNPLSNEEMEYLRKHFLKEEFSLIIPKVEKLQAKCTHRDCTGEKLMKNDDNSVTCNICQTTFRPSECKKEDIDKSIEMIVNVLETIKIMYFDIPDDVVNKMIAVLIPNLKKVSELYEIAMNHFINHNRLDLYNGNSNDLFNVMNVPSLFKPMNDQFRM